MNFTVLICMIREVPACPSCADGEVDLTPLRQTSRSIGREPARSSKMMMLDSSASRRPRRRTSLCVLSFASLLDCASSWSPGAFQRRTLKPPHPATGGLDGGRVGRFFLSASWTVGHWPHQQRRRRRTSHCALALRLRRSRNDDDDDDDESLNYWESDEGVVSNRRARASSSPRRGDANSVEDFGGGGGDSYDTFEYGDDDFGQSEDGEALEWEACRTEDSGTAHVLLPTYTSSSSTSVGGGGRRPPTCIIHFVGGTFFGSSPTVWYGKLLRDVVRHSSAAVVASSIPLTVLQSPLQHVQLAKKVARQFEAAYNDVLVDEYGADALRSVPVCALGHSLGSRLLVVSATLQQQRPSASSRWRGDDDNDNSRRGRGSALSSRWVTPPPYRSYILMSFTNFGAAAGIPGVGTLYKARRQVDRQLQNDSGDGAAQQRRRQQQPQPQQRRRPNGRRQKQSRDGDDFDRLSDVDDDDDMFDDYGDDGEDMAGLWEDLTSVVKESARWIQSSLTPDASALEFYPTPAQLWKALSPASGEADTSKVNGKATSGGGGGRYRVPQTLLIQFDQDRVDQSAKLAATIRECSDVKFARLRGTHLSPLAPNPQLSPGSLLSLGRGGVRSGRGPVEPASQALLLEQSTLSDLRQTIVRYTTEIVTKGVGQDQDVQV
jgi:Protein of unknown function (DUF1350)